MFSDPEGCGLEVRAVFSLNQRVELKSCVGSQAGRDHENAEPGRLGSFELKNYLKVISDCAYIFLINYGK